MKLLIYILFTINAFCLDLELVTKIKIPSNSGTEVSGTEVKTKFVRNDGIFVVQTGPAGSGLQFLVNSDGKYFQLPTNGLKGISYTNYVSQYVQDGELHIIQDVVSESTSTWQTDAFIAAMTFGKNGYLVQQQCGENNYVLRYDISNNGSKSILISQASTNYTKIIRFDSYGNEILSKKYYNKTFSFNNDDGFYNQNSKTFIQSEVKDGYIYLYKLIDNDILNILSPNRITLGSSQNGSLTATVNNPEQSLLNIQSSTNLIDWNTFKTIQNEPSLEIVVPANKPKEFIRAIE